MKKKRICHVLALVMVLSLFAAVGTAALADGGDGFEPITVADDDSVKIVATDLTSSTEDGAASFTLEITNKTDMGLEFSFDAVSVNDRMCPLTWVESSEPTYGEPVVDIPAGETRSVSAGWGMRDLAQVGVNYAESAEGLVTAKWSADYYREKADQIADDDIDAWNALELAEHSFDLNTPFSLTFPAVETDLAAQEDVIYDTDFEPVVIVDDENVTAVIHDYYADHNKRPYSDEEIGPSLVISVENRTGDMLKLSLDASVDGNYGSVNGGGWIPPGKTLIDSMSFSLLDENGRVYPTSADNIKLGFALLDEDSIVYRNYSMELELDVTPYADSTSSVYGTAAWVENPVPEETPEPAETADTELEGVQTEQSPEDISNQLVWIPDPDTDAAAVITLGDGDVYRVGLTCMEGAPGIILYFENNSDETIFPFATEAYIDGESVICETGYFGEPMVQPSDAIDCILEIEPSLPSGRFDASINLRFDGETNTADATVSASFSETGEATIN